MCGSDFNRASFHDSSDVNLENLRHASVASKYMRNLSLTGKLFPHAPSDTHACFRRFRLQILIYYICFQEVHTLRCRPWSVASAVLLTRQDNPSIASKRWKLWQHHRPCSVTWFLDLALISTSSPLLTLTRLGRVSTARSSQSVTAAYPVHLLRSF